MTPSPEERAVARRHAREAYDEFADKKADLVSRARVQREWSSQGVRNAMKKSPDNDKIRRKAQTESSEKQGQKVRQMESRIARLEEVEEPRKEWVLQFDIAAAPRGSSVVATLDGATKRSGDFVLGPVSLRVTAGDRVAITGPNGGRQDDAAAARPRAHRARRGACVERCQCRHRRDRLSPDVAR
ncbi:hypothetical protein [Nocardioides sp. B-3]|uniref:hypothetical protein n=1 Tax=Nocardioides sp. B-3 TaxID=2895565 RepID=UPI0021532984|nr:hypothetical protein [Nocardioides sp. B-3]UUZ59271.1 hypothetical protein LP418_25965 [Nocardioides sp. B-3]